MFHSNMPNELRSFDNPPWRRTAGSLADLQELFSDKLVGYNNPLAFLPYFLTGGHDTSDALRRIEEQGLNRPVSRWNVDTNSRESPKAQALGDLFSASQLAVYGTPLEAARRGIGSVGKSLPDVFNPSRREFMKKSAAGGATTLPGWKIAAAAAAIPATTAAVKTAGKYKYNSLGEYLAGIKGLSNNKAEEFIKSLDYVPTESRKKIIRQQEMEYLIDDLDDRYRGVKRVAERLKSGETVSPKEMAYYKQHKSMLDEMSPDLKKEMKESWKQEGLYRNMVDVEELHNAYPGGLDFEDVIKGSHLNIDDLSTRGKLFDLLHEQF
jgi:hypothetical protein